MINKDKVTVINLGWSASFIVNVKDVSPLLDILNRSQAVRRRWADKEYWVIDEAGKVSIEQDSAPIVSKESFEVIEAAADAARKAKEEAEKEEQAAE